MQNFFDKSGFSRVGKVPKNFNFHRFMDNEARKNFNEEDEFVIVWYDKDFIVKQEDNTKTFIRIILLNISKDVFFEYDKELRDWKDSKSIVKITIPINFIHKLPIGSIWKNYKFIDRFILEEFEITIDPTNEESYSIHSIANAIRSSYGNPIHKKTLPFEYQQYLSILSKDRNQLINVDFENVNYVIHPISLFIAHYGLSMDIKRIMSTDPWSVVQDKLCINTIVPQFEEDENIDKYTVLPRNFNHRDAVFLNYLKYDEYCRIKVQNLVNHINISKNNDYTVKVDFWHNQEIKLRFQGITIGNSVLCASITGINEPRGDAINVAIRNPSKLEAMSEDTEHKEFMSYQTYIPESEIEKLDITRNPVNNLAFTDIKEKIKILGTQREINKIQVDNDINRDSAILIPQEEHSEFSVGDLRGRGRTGSARCFYDASNSNSKKDESRFRTLWDHATRLRALYGAKVEWFTFKKGFHETDNFTRISLEEIHKIYPNNRKPISVLVVKVVISNINYLVLEFGNDSTGLVYREERNEDFLNADDNGLIDFLIKVVLVEGVFNYDFIELFQGKLSNYKHSYSETNSNNWVLNGISRLT